ncbi:MAG: DUF5615 family PIN-like protein [Thermoguttaceae bacterium]|jgi:predicted nuclease of predicted toxin-antitoxin system
MRFLADQDVYSATARFLVGLGHDVVTASQLGLAQAEDAALLRTAHEQRRVLLTRDRDYGGLVFVRGTDAGVIYLRLLPSTQKFVHAELERVLALYPEHDLCSSFVVVEPGRHRIRRLPPGGGSRGAAP